jgi:hypothetical protein
MVNTHQIMPAMAEGELHIAAGHFKSVLGLLKTRNGMPDPSVSPLVLRDTLNVFASAIRREAYMNIGRNDALCDRNLQVMEAMYRAVYDYSRPKLDSCGDRSFIAWKFFSEEANRIFDQRTAYARKGGYKIDAAMADDIKRAFEVGQAEPALTMADDKVVVLEVPKRPLRGQRIAAGAQAELFSFPPRQASGVDLT